jgi:16S rRNA G966 N2-methylase RsmD
MAECCSASGYEDLFNAKEAEKSLRSYEKDGLDETGRALVEYMTSRGLKDRTILEAGGGIGALQVELIKSGAASVVNVELSGEYEAVATALLAKQGIADRVERRIGDFTEVAAELEADDVVLHRVICCYPFMERLMIAAMSASSRLVAASFPRDRLVVKTRVALENAWHKIRSAEFRAYVHDPDAIVATARSQGFGVVFWDRNFSWNAAVFERV